MNQADKKIKIFIISVYFGPLPDYFCLWLASCARNPDFDWLLITDNDLSNYDIPQNVVVQQTNLAWVRGLFSDKLGFEVPLFTPYKLCDFRPLYWILLDEYNIDYDFWGHCDIDVIFGRLSNFIKPEMLMKFDRIFGLGHLSIMRSSPIAKLAFTLKSSAPQWKTIFTDPINFGFDEHHGVNRTWREYPLRFCEDQTVVADIDPQFRSFRLTQLPLNKNRQLFFYEDGKIFQGFFDKNERWQTREFAYIHFQKRKMLVPDGILESERIVIGPSGFSALPFMPTKESEFDELFVLNESRSITEQIARLKTWIRFYRRKLLRGA